MDLLQQLGIATLSGEEEALLQVVALGEGIQGTLLLLTSVLGDILRSLGTCGHHFG